MHAMAGTASLARPRGYTAAGRSTVELRHHCLLLRVNNSGVPAHHVTCPFQQGRSGQIPQSHGQPCLSRKNPCL
ncbi:hypothetical protein BKA66DRAFT_223595 [Pyrenochaeta sp. MPI-SDFR-AT-0127]|nr:hypothetical protein BKA66DRAFT_223595 [Pyrenochaeta sp. MPI-SDFR-AT-0127]